MSSKPHFFFLLKPSNNWILSLASLALFFPFYNVILFLFFFWKKGCCIILVSKKINVGICERWMEKTWYGMMRYSPSFFFFFFLSLLFLFLVAWETMGKSCISFFNFGSFLQVTSYPPLKLREFMLGEFGELPNSIPREIFGCSSNSWASMKF